MIDPFLCCSGCVLRVLCVGIDGFLKVCVCLATACVVDGLQVACGCACVLCCVPWFSGIEFLVCCCCVHWQGRRGHGPVQVIVSGGRYYPIYRTQREPSKKCGAKC